MEKLDTALAMQLNALKIREQYNNISDLNNSYSSLGMIYFARGNYKLADKYLKKALDNAKIAGNLFTMNNCYLFLISNDSAMGNYASALSYLREQIKVRDSLYNKANTEKILQTKIQYDFDKKEAVVKAQQDLKDAVSKVKIKQQKIIIIAILLGSSLLLMALLLFINRRRSKHALEVNKLENKTLRSQLNPHFIFNALASIQKYMNENPEKAENYLAKFGKLMREVLENSERDYITLDDEIAMLKKYMDLEKLRVSNGFNYQFNIAEDIDTEAFKLPPLLLQPIVENAIWHGVAKSESLGEINVTVEKENEYIKIEVENKSESPPKNLIESTASEAGKRKSFGQQIVKERLSLLSKEKSKKCKIEMNPTPKGMKVEILIPQI